MNIEKLDAEIQKYQKKYKALTTKIRFIEAKLHQLFEKRYPDGRFHETFYKH